MKQKKYLILAAAAALFAACSSDDGPTAPEQQAAAQAGETPVTFSAYVNRGTTRAGDDGELVTNGGSAPTQINLETVGFGVFGYYTDGMPYSETSIPDFMYNQKVTKDGDWKYTPVKYWPNEFGADAKSDGKDMLTFFAYAPYVKVIPGTGRIDQVANPADNALTSGIVGLTSNVTTGDPYVKYYVDFDPDNCVDLCYGVAGANFTSTVTGATPANNITEGESYVDVVKPTTDSKINFLFKHALAALNVQIDADVDVVSHNAGDLAGATKIWVRSVTFEGFTNKGSLNLHSEATPLWYELSSTNTAIGSGNVTIYDGRRDGKEGQANGAASNENIKGLNPNLIQSEAYNKSTLSETNLATTGSLPGVTHTAVNLFAANEGTDDQKLKRPIYVIPTNENLKVTIVYDVETYDPKVAGFLSDGVTKGSTIENKITKEITISDAPFSLAAGKVYTIGLHLGMTSVKFDASVTNWVPQTADKTDLPINTAP